MIEYDTLLAVSACARNTCQSIVALCDVLLIQHHVASETVSKLAGRNLLKTKRNGSDRRSIILSLTPAGELLLQQIAVRSLEHLREDGHRIETSLARIVRKGGDEAKEQGPFE